MQTHASASASAANYYLTTKMATNNETKVAIAFHSETAEQQMPYTQESSTVALSVMDRTPLELAVMVMENLIECVLASSEY